MCKVRLLLSTLFIISIVLSSRVYSEEDLLRVEMDAVGLYNPMGLSFSASAYYRDNYEINDSILWNQLYWQTGGQIAANPAYQRAGVHFEWVPITVLQARIQYDRYYFSGDYGTLLTFNNTDGPFGDDEIKAREGEEQSGYGDRYLSSITLRAKLGNVVIRNVSQLSKYEFPGLGPYYLEREYELLMAQTDYLFSNQFYLLFESQNNKGRKRFFGPYYDYVRVRETRLERERLGVTFYQENSSAWGFLNSTRWYVQGGVYLTERNRQDEAYLVVGFGGDYDF
ncbi:MAG: hypothetical protein OEY52_15595 [Gammaproteobacteria bacterium]|nr:hypothetical protein [Gammaproteobacteria bacterium]